MAGSSREYNQPRTNKNVYQYGTPIGQEENVNTGYAGRKDPMQAPDERPDASPPAKVVLDFHKNAPTDTRPDDIHHTLGSGALQAARGDHSHNGGADGALLLEGFTITGSKSNPTTMMPSIIQCLVRLGAEDATTA